MRASGLEVRVEEGREPGEQVDEREEGKPTRHVYLGETSRGCFRRYQEHAQKYRNRDNFMWEHSSTVHGEVAPSQDPKEKFGMVRKAVDRDSTRRIAREAVGQKRILDREDGTEFSINDGGGKERKVDVKTVLLNSKEEFHLPKLVNVNLSQQ